MGVGGGGSKRGWKWERVGVGEVGSGRGWAWERLGVGEGGPSSGVRLILCAEYGGDEEPIDKGL